MLRTTLCVVEFSIIVFLPVAAVAQIEIASIPFESIPGGTSFVGGGSPIELQFDTNVTGTLSATGELATDTGVRFPDGTVQVTAGAAGAGLTANAGLYSNTIADITPPNDYTEICVKAGAVMSDIHGPAEPTAGGNCLPGDTGWILERFERDAGTTATWTTARMECLKSGMRLPEPFEWQFACNNEIIFAMNEMKDTFEWVTNSTDGVLSTSVTAVSAAVIGLGSCSNGSTGSVANTNGSAGSWEYRCAR